MKKLINYYTVIHDIRQEMYVSLDNIKVELRKIEWGGMDWIDLAQDRDQCRTLVKTVVIFLVL
jgi:hypothetical protein